MDRATEFDMGSPPRLASGTTLKVAAKKLAKSAEDAAVVLEAAGNTLGLIMLRKVTVPLSSAAEARQ